MRKNNLVIVGVPVSLILIIALLLLGKPSQAPRSRMFSSRIHSSPMLQPPADGGLFVVARVIDGDTIDVFIQGDHTARIRFIGIDTPETVDRRKPVQCYGPEASARMKELLTGKSVTLLTKPDEDHDDYGRFLRYVTQGGKDIGATMLEEGYARSPCFAFPHPRCPEYEELERRAVSAKRGRWGSCK